MYIINLVLIFQTSLKTEKSTRRVQTIIFVTIVLYCFQRNACRVKYVVVVVVVVVVDGEAGGD